MSYIYKITNSMNGRVYVGQSKIPLDKKWKLHKQDAKKESEQKRPLYDAMNKYGMDAFKIQIIENVSDDTLLNEREAYWIEYYDSFRNGYNATSGGAGKQSVDYGKVYETYKMCGSNCKKTAKILNVDESTVSMAVKSLSGLKTLQNPMPQSKRINMFLKSGEYVRTFSSAREAARDFIQETHANPKNEGGYSRHICEVCKGKRKTACGYIWRYAT